MRKIILAVATLNVFLAAGCGSNNTSNTSTENVGTDELPAEELPAEQTPIEMESAEESQTTENSDQETPVTVDPTPAPTPTNPLDGIGAVQRIGPEFSFLEGPAYRVSDSSLYFSDIPENTIFRLDAEGSIQPFRENQQTNGLLFDSQNRLLIATHGGRSLTRLEEAGSVTVLADRFEGALLNSPNDIALHSNGDVFFTDPPYGIDPAATEVGCSGVYRLSAAGDLSRFWCNGIETRPNGIALSPNQDQLYVAFTLGGEILSWSIAPDGSVGEMSTFAQTEGGADGMVVDAEGNIFVTTVAGVEVFAPDGNRWGVIEVPEQPANCTLGGPDGNTLFITARTGLYSVQLQ